MWNGLRRLTLLNIPRQSNICQLQTAKPGRINPRKVLELIGMTVSAVDQLIDNGTRLTEEGRAA